MPLLHGVQPFRGLQRHEGVAEAKQDTVHLPNRLIRVPNSMYKRKFALILQGLDFCQESGHKSMKPGVAYGIPFRTDEGVDTQG
ncbi:hypothetical protein, partial [Paenibacillus antri]|uniref:hypothetical protein n=1 Tax=Paenibacillus antri TaxID=2582848 RepID=UPI001EE4A739